MNTSTLRSRGIYPSCSIAGYLQGYELTFTYDGYAGCEPRFANIEKFDVSDESKVNVHGVAHKITAKELELLDEFEGIKCTRSFVVIF